jgi:electron transfer flavoprotein alpha subunit
MSVLVLLESNDELSLQALAFARTLGLGETHGVAIGADVQAGVDVLHVATLDTPYAPGAWAAAVVGVARSICPDAIVAAGTDRANEVLAHVGARLDLPFAANCIAVVSDTVTRLRWGGSLLEEARLDGAPGVFTVAPFAVSAEAPSAPRTVETFEPELADADLAVRVVERLESIGEGVSLSDAKVVVSGGRGVGSAEGFAVIEELAGLLGGAVGCSRVVTSAGWRPHSDQVGQTGTKITADLYIACGISGATQHIAGTKGVKKILVINEDREAPILASADYAVIGDLHEIVPAISAELRRVRGR